MRGHPPGLWVPVPGTRRGSGALALASASSGLGRWGWGWGWGVSASAAQRRESPEPCCPVQHPPTVGSSRPSLAVYKHTVSSSPRPPEGPSHPTNLGPASLDTGEGVCCSRPGGGERFDFLGVVGAWGGRSCSSLFIKAKERKDCKSGVIALGCSHP